MKPLKIIWSKQAVTSVKNIYDFYKEKSPQGAIHVKNEILNGPKKLFFAHQYQLDDINTKYLKRF